MNKQNEKYKTMLRRKNKEKKIYKDKNSSLQFEKQKLYRALLNREQEIERLNNIIKEAKEILKFHLSNPSGTKNGCHIDIWNSEDINKLNEYLGILDKGKE